MSDGKIKVLIADDQADIRNTLSDILIHKGYEVATARDGHEAIELGREEDPFDIIILDIKMPRLNGVETLKAIKDMYPEAIVIMLTAYASIETAIKAIKHGASGYITKPINFEEMYATIDRAIEKKRLIWENKRLLESLRESNRKLFSKLNQLHTINEVSQTMSSTLDLDRLLNLIVDKISNLLKSERASLMLLEKNSGELIIRAAKGVRKDIVEKTRVRIGEKVSGWVAREAEPLINIDVEEDARFEVDRERNYSSKTFISTPVIKMGEVVGVLNVTNRLGGGMFTEDDLDLASGFASDAAIAIENAGLYTNLEKALEETRRTQEQLTRREKLASLGMMTAGVAHELKNPMSIVFAGIQLLQRGIGVDHLSQELDKMERQMERCAIIVENLLGFTREEEADAHPVMINNVLKDSLALTEPELLVQNVKVVKKFSSNIPNIIINGDRIKQVFVNLILNACHAMPKGGQLTVATSLVNGERVQISISDTGKGIPEEILAKIFDPLFTTKRGDGSGLGLSISKKIIEAHKGKINVKSQLRKGTTFIISLPLLPTEK